MNWRFSWSWKSYCSWQWQKPIYVIQPLRPIKKFNKKNARREIETRCYNLKLIEEYTGYALTLFKTLGFYCLLQSCRENFRFGEIHLISDAGVYSLSSILWRQIPEKVSQTDFWVRENSRRYIWPTPIYSEFLYTLKNSFLYDDCLLTNTIVIWRSSGIVFLIHRAIHTGDRW